jgi:pimeloyl-ACP methyl ester carboxylesterase
MARMGDLLVDHAVPSGRRRPAALLFVHGMWSGSWLFARALELAAQAGWEAWALNLRGHYGSRPVADLGRVRLADYAQDVTDVLEKIGPSIVAGYSMGGLVAQMVASRPEVRAAVFMVSAAPRGIVTLRWPVIRRMARYAGAILSSRPFRLDDADAVALLLNRVSPGQRAALLARFVDESGRVARELAFRPPAVEAARVRGRTLVVAASEDLITPPAVERRIARKYGSDYLEAQGHGHLWIVEEGGDATLEQVLGWMERAAG